ncbi:MAG: ArsR family transcriptional regulator [Syntrophobacterales bacterium]|nr:MAG: ArsR family transcriptional regulator [Syntrophobacterales bacterium]
MKGVDYKNTSEFFRTLGNPTRLKILKELTQGERCVGAVECKVSASQANVSQHLTILKKQGIVNCRKEKKLAVLLPQKARVHKKYLGVDRERGKWKRCRIRIERGFAGYRL